MKTFTPKNLDETILAAMARAIWVSAYADAAESGDIDRDTLETARWSVSRGPGDGDPWEILDASRNHVGEADDESEAIRQALALSELEPCDKASNGSDWMDVAPEAPVRALLVAQTWLDATVKANAVVCIWQLAGRALAADDPAVPCEESYLGGLMLPHVATYASIPDTFASDFGCDIAMEIMGHGVSWFDDHAEFPLELPRRECPQWADLKD